MVLEIINREIEQYKKLISSTDYDELYKWEALKSFQDNWDPDSNDFKSMYDRSLHSKHSGNLWANPHWFPKAVMLKFIEHDENRVRQMFLDLFDEGGHINGRIERFVFNCDELIRTIYEFDKAMKNHFHDGQRMVSLYLAFRFPDRYAIYKFTEFKTFMEIVKAKDIPGTGEHERFFKVVKTLYGILTRDPDLVQLHRRTLTDECYKGETLMLAQDFIFRTARRYMT